MEDQDNVPQQYLDGFNKGYTIAETMPELAEQLQKAKGNSIQLEGIKDGIEQLNKEKSKDLPPWLKKDRLSSLDKEPEKDKDGLEKE